MTYDLSEITRSIEQYGQEQYDQGYEDGSWHVDDEDDQFDVWNTTRYAEESMMLAKGLVRRVVHYNGQEVVNWIQGWNYDR